MKKLVLVAAMFVLVCGGSFMTMANGSGNSCASSAVANDTIVKDTVCQETVVVEEVAQEAE
ncbi:MAG: hypothetical protein LUE93_03295 [Bacteroides sp.]|nr:hypothetical protein [Bacteroides sp.]